MELLAPAGGMQAAVTALTSGADAVYLGLHRFSARSSAENFDDGALGEIIRLAHLLHAKVYVALNTLVKDSELGDFFAAALAVWNAGADAILIQDLFLGRELKRRYPDIVLHLSTQAGCCNVYGALLARDFGFSRVVLARETPLSDMATISKVIETEVFVQGALCTAFSGQCYLSSFAGNHSGNRGRCKQPCRKKYRIDRAGFEEEAYALSTSDLMLAGRLGELRAAGVCSLKIEGRMRREEYVGAAVKYYRSLLDGTPSAEALTMLRRAYNRGDYTEGLAFGQKNFLSRDVQGHIGERIGWVSFRHGMPVCVTAYRAERGDGFKILRGGKEVGGAAFGEETRGGFVLAGGPFREGDEVRLTTSARSNDAALAPVKKRELKIRIRFRAGEVPRAEAEGYVLQGETPLDAARAAPIDGAALFDCFCKTDGLPFHVTVEADAGDAFLPKSALNAFRRAFYDGLVAHLCPPRKPLKEVDAPLPPIERVRGVSTAEIGERPHRMGDIFVYKPADYRTCERPEFPCVYLYLPPFLTQADEEMLGRTILKFDGIYADGYYGIALAAKYRKPLFAGTGFNLTNRIAVCAVGEFAEFFALSKELSSAEQDALAVRGAFALYEGGIKVMDLIHCPFGRACENCDRRNFYRMTDEDGRVFPLRRYRVSDMVCRFEVYNCASLQEQTRMCSLLTDNTELTVRGPLHTKGHSDRSML